MISVRSHTLAELAPVAAGVADADGDDDLLNPYADVRGSQTGDLADLDVDVVVDDLE